MSRFYFLANIRKKQSLPEAFTDALFIGLGNLGFGRHPAHTELNFTPDHAARCLSPGRESGIGDFIARRAGARGKNSRSRARRAKRGEAAINAIPLLRKFRKPRGRKTKIHQRYHAHPLIKLLFDTVKERDMTITELAKKSGVSRHAIYDWSHRSNASLVNLVACLNVVGIDLVAVKREAK